MINIDKHADSGCRALLPPPGPASLAEVFSLSGRQTRIGRAAGEPSTSEQPEWRFRPLDPSLDLPERRGSFSEAERDNILCLLASPDRRFGSLQINAAVQIYTSRLGAGHTITFRPKPDQLMRLQPISGGLTVNGIEVGAGGQATVSDEPEVQILAQTDCEFVLLVLS